MYKGGTFKRGPNHDKRFPCMGPNHDLLLPKSAEELLIEADAERADVWIDSWDCEVSQPEISLSCTQDFTAKKMEQHEGNRPAIDAASSPDTRFPQDGGSGAALELTMSEERSGNIGPDSARTEPCKPAPRGEEWLMNSQKFAHTMSTDMKLKDLKPLTSDILLRKLRIVDEKKPVSISSMQQAGKSIMHASSVKKSYYVSPYSKVYDGVIKDRELDSLRALFSDVDVDNSGEIDLVEFLSIMRSSEMQRIFAERFGFQPHHGEAVFHLIDQNRTGRLDFVEWDDYCHARMQHDCAEYGPPEFAISSVRDKRKNDVKTAPRPPFKAKPYRQYRSAVKHSDPNITVHTSKWFFNLNPVRLPSCEPSTSADNPGPSTEL